MTELIQRVLTAACLLAVATLVWLSCPAWVITVLINGIALYVLLIEWPRFKLGWLTLCYPLIPFIALIMLNQSAYRNWLPFLCLLTAIHDTGAYFVGRLWGYHKIAPAISPKKSWEGFFGGFVLAFVSAPFLLYNSNIKMSYSALFYIVLLLNSAGLAGDLFESYLKRRVGLKDSGNLLPGHGGVLDRLDSLFFVVMLFYGMVMLGFIGG